MFQWRWMVLGVCLVWPLAAYGQQRPLLTDDAELLPVGRVRAELGAEFLQGQFFRLSGLEGDLTRLGVMAIHAGVGDYAEFQMSGVVRDDLSVASRTTPFAAPSFTGNSTHSVGDLILGTKLKLVEEKGERPAIAFKFAVELPNANQASGLGNDATEFYSSILVKKHFGGVQVLGDVGLAILSSPIAAARQEDSLTYGIATVIPISRRLNFAMEVNGRQGPKDRIGNENKSQARAGIQLRAGGLRWDLGGVAGLTHYDPKSGIIVGATFEFQAFRRNVSPVRIQ